VTLRTRLKRLRFGLATVLGLADKIPVGSDLYQTFERFVEPAFDNACAAGVILGRRIEYSTLGKTLECTHR
jgi:hypothetical protein